MCVGVVWLVCGVFCVFSVIVELCFLCLFIVCVFGVIFFRLSVV